MKNVTKYFICLLVVFLISGCGDNSDNNKQKTNKEETKDVATQTKKDENYYNFSNSKNNDNIAFPMTSGEDWLYLIQIKDKNISKDFKISRDYFGNDKFQLSEYKFNFNPGFAIRQFNGYTLVFSISKSWENKTFDPNRSIIREDDQQLLVKEEIGGVFTYAVYAKTEQGYIRINGFVHDAALADTFFDFVTTHITVATANYTLKDKLYHVIDFSSAKHANQSIDIKDWTFANDIIANQFRDEGISVKASSHIRSFNRFQGFIIHTYQYFKDTTKNKNMHYTFKAVGNKSYKDAESIMEFKAGSVNWKITNFAKRKAYAIIKTKSGKEYQVELEYQAADSHETRKMVKDNIMKYCK